MRGEPYYPVLSHYLTQPRRRSVFRFVVVFLGHLLIDVNGLTRIAEISVETAMLVPQIPELLRNGSAVVHDADSRNFEHLRGNIHDVPEFHIAVVQVLP